MQKLKSYFNSYRLFILFVAFVFYGNTINNKYALDDSIVTEKGNITTEGLKSIPKIFKSHYVDRSEDIKFDYRPIVKVSYAIEHELFGVNAGISHFVNILLYACGLLALYSVLLIIFSEHNPIISFYIVVLFACLPIHSEVVASLKNRDILLCFIFCMLGLKNFALFFYQEQKKWQKVLIGVICFSLAFLSKFDVLPYLAIVPVVLFAKKRNDFKWVLGFVGLFILSYVFYKFTKKHVLEKSLIPRVYYYFENPLYYEKSFRFKIIACFNSLGFYIQQILLPIKQCSYYGLDTISINKLNTLGYFGIVISPVLIFGLVKSYIKKNYLLFVGLFIFCASVSMYLNVVRPAVGIVADRFAFFSSLGGSITIIALLIKFFPQLKTPTKTIKIYAGVLIFICFLITFSRNKDWKDIYTLVEADYKKYPNNSFLNYKQGLNTIKLIEDKTAPYTTEQKLAKIKEARVLIEKSIQIDSTYYVSQAYLSYVLIYLINDFKAALPHVNTAIRLKETTELYFYKGICFRELKQADSSEKYLFKCIARDSVYYNAYDLLLYDYEANKTFDKSISLLQSAIKKGVNEVKIYNALGKAYWQSGNNIEANIYYNKALNLDATNQEAAAMVKRTSAVVDTTIKNN